VLRRNLGLEAVLRIRCTTGIQLNTFHGNFFMRSSDLLALPNVSPNNAYTFQLSVCAIDLIF
jgi:protein transport protein SEC24